MIPDQKTILHGFRYVGVSETFLPVITIQIIVLKIYGSWSGRFGHQAMPEA